MHPLGNVKLVNRDDKPYQTMVSFYIPKLMDAPTEQQVIIRPKETKEVGVKGVFSSSITNLTEDILTQAEVRVSYTTERRTRSDRESASFYVYSRNATTWDDVGKAAAFITSNDPIIGEFARPTLVAHEEEIKGLGRGSRNLIRAMVLFDVVHQYGVRYIADSNNPYSRISADKSAVDNIQYPVEVLRKKSGDCDDLTALYCALLENVGIPTALVDAPGHIYMMFDSGVPIQKAYSLPIGEKLYVVRDGRIWIPVEITLFGKSFTEAWRSGAGESASLLEEDMLRVVDTSDVWQEYEPSPPKFEGEIAFPTKEDIKGTFSTDRSGFKEMMDAFIERTHLGPLGENPEDFDLRFKLARVYTAIREYDRSISQYQHLLETDADPAQVYNNMGIAYLLKGEVKKAAQDFKRAVDLDPTDEGIKGNFELAMSFLEGEERIAFAREIGVAVPEGVKAAEFEVDEESFYWRE